MKYIENDKFIKLELTLYERKNGEDTIIKKWGRDKRMNKKVLNGKSPEKYIMDELLHLFSCVTRFAGKYTNSVINIILGKQKSIYENEDWYKKQGSILDKLKECNN